MTQVVDLNSFDAAVSFPAFSVGQLAAALGLPDEPYSIVVTDMAGSVLAALTSDDPAHDPNQAHPEDIVETLNAYTTFAITFPKYAFDKSQVDILGNTSTEMLIQVFLGPECIAWGPAIAESGGSGSGSVTLQCAGTEWYFAKRAIDEEKTNLLSYGGFESGDIDTGWNSSGTTLAGASVGDGITATIETDNVFQGTYAARLVGFAPPTGLGLVSEPVNFTAGPIGNRIELTFSFCIEEFVTPALFNAGVMLIAGPVGLDALGIGGVNSVGTQVYRIDETTPRNVEVRESLEVQIPPNQTWRLQVWLFVGSGSTAFDHFFLAPKKRLSTAALTGSATATIDASRIVRLIADHTFSNLHGHNKSNLHIGLNTPDCGVKQARRYEFDDHVPVDQAFSEFLDRDDCFDMSVDLTATTRTLHLWPITDGGQGTDRSADVTLTYGQAPFASYTTGLDGGSAATQIVEFGDGNIREEAWATDTTQIGTTLQDAINAPTGTPFNSLAPLARSAVLLRRKAAEVLEITITREAGGYGPDGTVILHDLLKVGDQITVDIADGWHTYSGVWRIVRRTRHCRTRTMQYTLNRVPV